VIDWNERSMTIKWKAPIDDGGAPITAYHIEARIVSGGAGDWQPWEMVDSATTRVTLQKLQRGQEYQFRVIALNRAGKSEPGHPSRPKLAKETDREYFSFFLQLHSCIIKCFWCPSKIATFTDIKA
jgi:Fibronectin type III domain